MNDRIYGKPLPFLWLVEVLEDIVLCRRHNIYLCQASLLCCFMLRLHNKPVRNLSRVIFSVFNYRLTSRDVLVVLNSLTLGFSLSSVLKLISFPTATSDTFPFHSQLHLFFLPNAPDQKRAGPHHLDKHPPHPSSASGC